MRIGARSWYAKGKKPESIKKKHQLSRQKHIPAQTTVNRRWALVVARWMRWWSLAVVYICIILVE